MAASQASDPAMSYWFRRDVSTVIRVSITPSVARSVPDLITDLISILVLPSVSLEIPGKIGSKRQRCCIKNAVVCPKKPRATRERPCFVLHPIDCDRWAPQYRAKYGVHVPDRYPRASGMIDIAYSSC